MKNNRWITFHAKGFDKEDVLIETFTTLLGAMVASKGIMDSSVKKITITDKVKGLVCKEIIN